jgi:hypothetical protein
MDTRIKVVVALVCAVFIGFSVSAAEELHIIKVETGDIDAISSLEGVNVYVILENALLVGMTDEGQMKLKKEKRGLEIVKSIGEMEKNKDYFFFHVESQKIEKLAASIKVVYFDGKEAIAILDKGAEFDIESRAMIRGLTRISFIPRPVVDRSITIPDYEPAYDPNIQDIVDQVSQVSYTAYLQRLQDFVTRYSYTDSCRAAEQWAISTFAGMGLDTELFPYSGGSGTWYNAIGRQIGTMYPDSIFMIIAHIDATSENPNNSAPGAEDNGSGSACVLEAARVLSNYDLDCTVEYVLVSGEEQGLYGSQAYASYCLSQGRKIGAVLNFDMIAYAGSYGWDTNIYADLYFPAEVAIADLLADLTDLYTDAYSIRINTGGPESGSDHYYFSLYGFPAPFSIDAQLWSAPDWYPWYHSTDDRIYHLDLDYATEVVKGGVATLATLALGPVPPLLEFEYPGGLPELVDPNGGTTFRVEVTAGTEDPQPGTGILYYNAGSGYTSIAMDVVSPNVYDAVFPEVDCAIDISFFVSAETVNDSVVTDPAGAPVATYTAFSAFALIPIFEDDFEMDKGWTVVNNCSDGQWGRGIPVGGDYRGNPFDDHDGSGRCYLTDNVVGDSDVDGGYTYLISPAVDVSGIDAIVEYALWYTNNFGNDPNNDLFKVWVSNDNGNNWTHVETVGPVSSSGWNEKSFFVSDFVTPTSQVKVRFEASDLNDGSVVEAGIDAFRVVKIDCGGDPDVTVTITPDDPPVEVPQGGSFTYTGSITNTLDEPAITDIWIMVDIPGHGMYGPVMQLNDFEIAAGRTMTRPGMTQQIPAGAPTGLYTYIAYTGYYPSSPYDSSSFEFTVISGAGTGIEIAEPVEKIADVDWKVEE